MLGSLSHGTHRPQDLIPIFMGFVSAIGDPAKSLDAAQQLGFTVAVASAYSEANLNAVPSHVWDDEEADWWNDEAPDLLSDLFDQLSDVAPEGYYFGAHPGDGSDFGFWKEPNEEEQ